MSENEFRETVLSVMHVAWAAAIGQLQQVNILWQDETISRSATHQLNEELLPKVYV